MSITGNLFQISTNNVCETIVLSEEESRNEIPLNGQSQQFEDRGRITEEEKLIGI